nr:amyloid fiber anchoring/assembly protein TapA [Thalassobacillus pellis]
MLWKIKKFRRKNRSLAIPIKLVSILYLLTVILSLATSDTGAFFHSRSNTTSTIQAGHWVEEPLWDKSSLKFEKADSKTIEAVMNQECGPLEISTIITNVGSDMKGSTEYEVYFAKKGNPKKGKKISENKIEIIKANQSTKLQFVAKEPGNYKFHALQRPGHGNKENERHDLWSETITVLCKKAEKKQTLAPDQSDSQEEKAKEEPKKTNEQPVKEEKAEMPAEQPTEKEKEATKTDANNNPTKKNTDDKATEQMKKSAPTPNTNESTKDEAAKKSKSDTQDESLSQKSEEKTEDSKENEE